MTTPATMTVRAGNRRYRFCLGHLREVDAESGVDGAAHSHPYAKSEPFDMEAARDRELTRWSIEIVDIAWRQAWGLFDRGELVGHAWMIDEGLPAPVHSVGSVGAAALCGSGYAACYIRSGGAVYPVCFNTPTSSSC